MAADLSLGSVLMEGNVPESKLGSIVRDIVEKRSSLTELVENLGPYLTSPDADQRSRGVRLLSDVLHRLVDFQLPDPEVELLVDFYCDRLKDHYSVLPHAVFGLLALASNQRLSNTLVVKVVQSLFQHVHVQSLLQAGRHATFSLFAVFLNKFISALKSLGSDFVFGFIQAMDGEKDPRNLVLVFQLVRVIIKNFPIDLFAEDLFEVTSCYFPVDFTPPPDDLYAVKKDDLVFGLRNCLAATNLFAPFCLPLLLEKLSSDIITAKIDSLKTLSGCLEVYPSEYLIEHLDQFWTGIKREVYQTVNSDLEEAALEAITSIVSNLANATEDSSVQTLKSFVETLQKDCYRHLCDPGTALARPSRRILEAAASGAGVVCWMIFKSSVPVITEQLTTKKEGTHSTHFVSLVSGLLKRAKTFHQAKDGEESPFVEHKGSISSLLYAVLSDATESVSDKCSAIEGLMSLVNIMTESEVEVLVQHFTLVMLNKKDPFIRQTSAKALAQLAREHPQIIKAVFLPQLEAQLKKDNGLVMKVDDVCPVTTPIGHQYVLDTISTVCTEDSLTRHVVLQLVEHAKSLCRDNQVTDEFLVRTRCVFKCIYTIVDNSLQRHTIQAEFFKEHLVPELLRMAIEPTVQKTDQSDIHMMTNAEILDSVAAVLRVITGNLEAESARTFLESILIIFMDGKVPFLGSNGQAIFSPLKVEAPWQQTQLVSLLIASVCAAKSEVEVPRQWELSVKLQNLACHCPHKKTAAAAAQGLAGIANKTRQVQLHRNYNELQYNEHVILSTSEVIVKLYRYDEQCLFRLHCITCEELNSQLRNIMGTVLQTSETDDATWGAVITWLWITKALVLRAHPMAEEFVHKLLNLLTVHGMGRTAADGFYIIMADSDAVMNQKMHANIRIMYRQRFFVQTLPKLLEGFHSASSDYKPYYLCALSHLLQWVPKQVLLTEVPNLMPLLVQSLSCEESNLKLTTLHTLYTLILATPETIIRHVTSLVPQFLSLGKRPYTMDIRSEALKCLGCMTSLPHHVVFPYRNKVTKSLADCLDDKKRLVRQEAVKCRNEWFMLGS